MIKMIVNMMHIVALIVKTVLNMMRVVARRIKMVVDASRVIALIVLNVNSREFFLDTLFLLLLSSSQKVISLDTYYKTKSFPMIDAMKCLKFLKEI